MIVTQVLQQCSRLASYSLSLLLSIPNNPAYVMGIASESMTLKQSPERSISFGFSEHLAFSTTSPANLVTLYAVSSSSSSCPPPYCFLFFFPDSLSMCLYPNYSLPIPLSHAHYATRRFVGLFRFSLSPPFFPPGLSVCVCTCTMPPAPLS